MQQMIFYRNLPYPEVFDDLNKLAGFDGKLYEDREAYVLCVNRLAGNLVNMAKEYGLGGNLFRVYLALAIAKSENSFSISCEKMGHPSDSMAVLVKQDLMLFLKLINFPFDEPVFVELKPVTKALCQFDKSASAIRPFPDETREGIMKLVEDLTGELNYDRFYQKICDFYTHWGVGNLGLYKAFRLREDMAAHAAGHSLLEPMTHCSQFTFDGLIGYKNQIRLLKNNTENFIRGEAANNCLLYGDAGTGKSSSVKACMNAYFSDGLRLIEVYKHQFKFLPDILKAVKGRQYKFIIFMDDLSFEEYEVEYKYLKAVIEGGLEEKPDNVLIYATSNRRHLIKETMKDNEERFYSDLHEGDVLAEKMSLSSRFGVSIFYGTPSQVAFKDMVLKLARKENIEFSDDFLLVEANKWELNHGGLSGRAARQFVTFMKGEQARRKRQEGIDGSQ